VEAAIVRRGRKAVLASHRAAAQFHTTSRFRQRSRNLGFRVGDILINSVARRAGVVRSSSNSVPVGPPFVPQCEPTARGSRAVPGRRV
jgi:hypothetical protein